MENMIAHLEKMQNYSGIAHTSPLVNTIKNDQSNIFKSREETIGHAYLRYLDSKESVFLSAKDSPRYAAIVEKLAKL